jgi:hypothetical protein
MYVWRSLAYNVVFDSPQAIRELNIKAKNWKDLLTDEPFTRADLITIQDPNNVDKSKLLSEFDHVKQNLGVDVADATQEDPTQGIRMSEDHKRVFQSLNTDEVSLHAHKICRRAEGYRHRVSHPLGLDRFKGRCQLL